MKIRIIKKRCLLSLLLLLPVYHAFSQADAGEDKMICKGSKVVIGGKGDPGWCYSWKPETGLSDPHILNPEAKPDVTTIYTLTVMGPEFSFSSTDQMEVKVVEPKVTLKVENNITECMEGRTVTFTAEAKDIPIGPSDPVNFIFHYEKADGTKWTNEEWSFDLIQDNTVMSDKVPDGDADHKFTTPIYVEIKKKDDECKTVSATMNIDVYELWIDFVKHKATGKSWKVVVGEEIDYKAIASKDCKNWKWDMEDGFPDTWNPSGGNNRSVADGGAPMVIPYSDLSSASNSYFGDAYGTVGVSCEDEEGNSHQIYSTSQTPSQKVSVFFDPDLNVDGGAPSTAKPPCWFIFWKDGVVVEDIDICSYDHSQQFGAWSSSKGMRLGPLAPTTNSGPETLNDMNGNPFSMTGTGKHLNCVAETITHELHHRDDAAALSGTDTDGDGLSDAEENSPSKAFFPRSSPTNNNTFSYALYAGTTYADEEVRCRIMEIKQVKATYPAKDWSKDVENPKW